MIYNIKSNFQTIDQPSANATAIHNQIQNFDKKVLQSLTIT